MRTSQRWSGCGRPIKSWSSKTVVQRGSPHPSPKSPNSCLGRIEPASCKNGPVLHWDFIGGNQGQAGIYVGIDVAKAKVDVAVRPTGERWEVPRDAAGIPQLVAELKTLGPSLVLLEATGGLELPLVAARAAEALPVVVVNPRQVRDFARATGKSAQTDARDAAVLAHFAEAIQPPVRPLRDAETQELNSLTARRQQVMTMLVSEQNRLGAATRAVRPRIAAHITWLEQDLNDLDQTTLTKRP